MRPKRWVSLLLWLWLTASATFGQSSNTTGSSSKGKTADSPTSAEPGLANIGFSIDHFVDKSDAFRFASLARGYGNDGNDGAGRAADFGDGERHTESRVSLAGFGVGTTFRPGQTGLR